MDISINNSSFCYSLVCDSSLALLTCAWILSIACPVYVTEGTHR